jgi:hypothetical protein
MGMQNHRSQNEIKRIAIYAGAGCTRIDRALNVVGPRVEVDRGLGGIEVVILLERFYLKLRLGGHPSQIQLNRQSRYHLLRFLCTFYPRFQVPIVIILTAGLGREQFVVER